MRLGFSVAIQVEADVLLIDEVMAVGDAAFQEKSGAALRERIDSGTTVVFVSHGDAQVRRDMRSCCCGSTTAEAHGGCVERSGRLSRRAAGRDRYCRRGRVGRCPPLVAAPATAAPWRNGAAGTAACCAGSRRHRHRCRSTLWVEGDSVPAFRRKADARSHSISTTRRLATPRSSFRSYTGGAAIRRRGACTSAWRRRRCRSVDAGAAGTSRRWPARRCYPRRCWRMRRGRPSSCRSTTPPQRGPGLHESVATLDAAPGALDTRSTMPAMNPKIDCC